MNNVDFKTPKVPIIANCTGQPLKSAEEIREELITQISGCVLWKMTFFFMIKSGVTNFLEIGPGKALGGMVKRIDRSASVTSVSDLESILALSRN